MAQQLILTLIIAIALGLGAYATWQSVTNRPENKHLDAIYVSPAANSQTPVASIAVAKTTPPTATIVEPATNFRQRVTKKPFGIFVTPQNSPVQPEKFTGYHTGADAEYGDVTSDVPVHAIATGQVLIARRASGYGGVVAIQHVIAGQKIVAIYGHLNPASLIKVGQTVTAGQQIGILGKGYSAETDGERKHLHIGLVKGTQANLRGYVSNKQDLSQWIDPLTIL